MTSTLTNTRGEVLVRFWFLKLIFVGIWARPQEQHNQIDKQFYFKKMNKGRWQELVSPGTAEACSRLQTSIIPGTPSCKRMITFVGKSTQWWQWLCGEGSLVVGAQSGAESRRWSVELTKVRSWGQAGLATGNPETQSRGHRRNREAGRFTRIKAKQTGLKQAGSEPGRQVEEKRTTLRNTLTIIATFQCETFYKQNVCA